MNCPEGHVGQDGVPLTAAYCPIGHTVHDPAVGPLNCPALQFAQGAVPPVEYVPPTHWVHAEELDTLVNVPGPHTLHAVEPATLKLPAAHDRHEVALVTGPYSPALQLVHVAAPPVEYRPTAHTTQAPATPPAYCPAGQLLQPDEPTPENCPAVQLVHTVRPVVAA